HKYVFNLRDSIIVCTTLTPAPASYTIKILQYDHHHLTTLEADTHTSPMRYIDINELTLYRQ
ncbi:hypothetical protein ACE4ZU_26945, partial [Salmonella enterica]|uniref:hypothetical protein n=1 Tax=Salmonella enterica TaxID=28901 RepID=UPI003D2D6264